MAKNFLAMEQVKADLVVGNQHDYTACYTQN